MGRHFVNVGVLGRPENDGRTNVWYALLEARPDFAVEFVQVEYDYTDWPRRCGWSGCQKSSSNRVDWLVDDVPGGTTRQGATRGKY